MDRGGIFSFGSSDSDRVSKHRETAKVVCIWANHPPLLAGSSERSAFHEGCEVLRNLGIGDEECSHEAVVGSNVVENRGIRGWHDRRHLGSLHFCQHDEKP